MLLQVNWLMSIVVRPIYGEELCSSHRWIIILGTGRSGSTSVLRMVNALPSVRVTGEHYGLLNDFMAVYKKLQRVEKMRGPAWRHEKFKSLRFMCWARSFFKCNNSTICGFKEIRYNTAEAIAFVARIFDEDASTRFILTYRLELAAQLRSHDRTHGFRASPDSLQAETTALLNFHANRGNRSVRLFPLEQFSRDSFTDLFAFLGFPHCRALRVAHSNKRHGFADDARADSNLVKCSGIDVSPNKREQNLFTRHR